MTAWLSAFLFTIAFEMPVFAWGIRRAFPDGGAQVAIAIGASLITHPVLWFCTSQSGLVDTRLLLTELTIAGVEAIYLFAVWTYLGTSKPSAQRCLVIALLANALSFGLGLLLFSY